MQEDTSDKSQEPNFFGYLDVSNQARKYIGNEVTGFLKECRLQAVVIYNETMQFREDNGYAWTEDASDAGRTTRNRLSELRRGKNQADIPVFLYWYWIRDPEAAVKLMDSVRKTIPTSDPEILKEVRDASNRNADAKLSDVDSASDQVRENKEISAQAGESEEKPLHVQVSGFDPNQPISVSLSDETLSELKSRDQAQGLFGGLFTQVSRNVLTNVFTLAGSIAFFAVVGLLLSLFFGDVSKEQSAEVAETTISNEHDMVWVDNYPNDFENDFVRTSVPPEVQQEVSGFEHIAAARTHEKEGRADERRLELLKASAAGNPTAELELAFSGYQIGKSSDFAVDFDGISASHSVFENAEAGQREAMYFYGLMLMHGLSVDASPVDAARYLEGAYIKGEDRAAIPLSLIILENDDVKSKCSGFNYAKEAKDLGYILGNWISARYLIGHLCVGEMGSKEEAIDSAISLLEQAVALKNPESQNLLGVLHKDSIGFSESAENDARATELFEAATRQGNIDGKNNLGVMYASKRGMTPAEDNDEKAIRLFREVATTGDARGQHNLGWMYMNGRVNGDPGATDIEAVKWLSMAAGQGYTKAEHDLGWMYEEGRVSVADGDRYTLAYKWYKLAANDGFAQSQHRIGQMYLDNRNLPQVADNEIEALTWFRKSAAQDYAKAQYSLGRMYYLRLGVPNDDEYDDKAFELFQKSAKQNYKSAINGLGVLYYYGRGVSQDYEKAFEWYKKAADRDDARAMNNLGYMYKKGEFVEQNDRIAFNLYQKSANGDDAWGQYNLALMYREGRGVTANDNLAFEWFQKSAHQGDSDAQNEIGWMYEHGRGVPKDENAAVIWYEKAAVQGQSTAQTNLALMYANGRGVGRDDKKAVEWYKRAADQGHARAQNNLGFMYEVSRGVPLSKNNAFTAVELYRKAAEQYYAQAQFNLGLMYKEDVGVPQDAENNDAAMKWFEKAANQEHAKAQYFLANMYLAGEGLATAHQNEATAVKWFNRSAENGYDRARVSLTEFYLKGHSSDARVDLAQEQLKRIIEERRFDFIENIMLGSRWVYFHPNENDEKSVQLCSHFGSKWCFGFSADQMAKKMGIIADEGSVRARMALVRYYSYQRQHCDAAQDHFSQLKLLAERENADAIVGISVIELFYNLCNWEVDQITSLKQLFEHAATGNTMAVRNVEELYFASNEFFDEQVPHFLPRLEEKSLEIENSYLWLVIAKFYYYGAPGVPKQYIEAEKWFKKAILAGAQAHSYELAKMYIDSFNPPRVTDAIETIIGNGSSFDQVIEGLESLIGTSEYYLEKEEARSAKSKIVNSIDNLMNADE